MFLELQSTNTAHQHVASLAKVKNLMISISILVMTGSAATIRNLTPRSPSSPAKTRRLEPPRLGPKVIWRGFPEKCYDPHLW